MQSRQYVVKMPTAGGGTTALDILVLSDPGSKDAPVTAGTDGAYYEWLGRPVRFETESGDDGFTPRLNLGPMVFITPIQASGQISMPGVQLSASLASLASTDSSPDVNVPALADGVNGPMIRLIGTADTAGDFFLVTLLIPTFADMNG